MDKVRHEVFHVTGCMKSVEVKIKELERKVNRMSRDSIVIDD